MIHTEQVKQHITERHLSQQNGVSHFTKDPSWIWENIEKICKNPYDSKGQGIRRKLYGIFDEEIGFYVVSNEKKVPVYTMLVVIEEYTRKIVTAYPDIAYPHRGPGYGKRHAGSFKGKQ